MSRPICKKTYIIPHDKPLPWRKHLIWFAVGLFLFIWVVLLTSCSMERKIANAYEYAANTNPVKTKDSLNAIKIGNKVIKPQPPKIIPGKTIIKKIPIDKLVLDTALISKIADSLLQVTLSQADTYNSNIDELIRDCDKAVRKGIKEGYKKALDSVGNIQLPPDTLPPDLEMQADLADCQIRQREAQAATLKAVTERDIYHKQAKERLWISIGLLLGLTFSIFVKAKGLIKTQVSK
jgi:hypothetical protein